MYKRAEQQSERTVITPPIDLDAGRLSPRDAWLGYALAFGLFLLTWLVVWFSAMSLYLLTFSSIVSAVFGFILSFFLGRSSYRVWHSVDNAFIRYEAFLEDVRDEWFESAVQMRGQPSHSYHSYEETTNEFTPSYQSMLALAISITQQMQHGSSKRLWTVDALTGNAIVRLQHGHGQQYVHLGRISPSMAEEIGRIFADLGVINGRYERSAGGWVPVDANDVVHIMSQNWPRIGGK
jgi:hypothetical protein